MPSMTIALKDDPSLLHSRSLPVAYLLYTILVLIINNSKNFETAKATQLIVTSLSTYSVKL